MVISFTFYFLVTIFSFWLKKFVNSFNLVVLYVLNLGILSVLFFYTVLDFILYDKNFSMIFNSNFLNSIHIELNFSLYFDGLSLLFSLLVSLIGVATNFYTHAYFKGEADESNFLCWLNFFILSMIILVLGGNFFTIFLGWELIGLTSFFLINFWNKRRGVIKSSFKALAFNLVSDIFLLTAFVLFYNIYNTSNCSLFITLICSSLPVDYYKLIFGFLCLLSCSAIKSVQIIGHLWLPDSMEAPVPASSLIHSATLVSAGIYLICRFQTLILLLDISYIFISIGSVTAAYGGIVAAAQTDMKKLLAYSTMSHCGFLWILSCSGNLWATILYLYLHGLFKAATFYCSGVFIRNYGSQDTRLMGSGAKFFRLDSFFLLFCSGNLAGLPFTVGAYYKFFFFKVALSLNIHFIFIGFIFLGMLAGVVYYFRLTNYVVFDFYKNNKQVPNFFLLVTKLKLSKSIKLTPINHIVAVTLLIIFSILSVYILTWTLTNNLFLVDSFLEELNTAIMLNNNIVQFYTLYILLYYLCYVFLVVNIFIVVCRPNIFSLENIYLLFYFSILFCFFF